MSGVDASVMLHLRKGIVEMMQECPPALILGRLPEANRMIFERGPTNQKCVAIRLLNASVKLERDEARHAGAGGRRTGDTSEAAAGSR